jgi:hypothetical protein
MLIEATKKDVYHVQGFCDVYWIRPIGVHHIYLPVSISVGGKKQFSCHLVTKRDVHHQPWGNKY